MALGHNKGSAFALVSSDGGSTWNSFSTATPLPPMSSVSCASASQCVAVGGGSAAVSTDGGQSWTVASLPTSDANITGVSCPVASTCFAVGLRGIIGVGPVGVVLTTTDGGQTWSNLALPSAQVLLRSITCTSSTDCLAAGDGVFQTNDGGQTWTMATDSGGIGAFTSISCGTNDQCVAVGPNPLTQAEPTASAVAAYSEDGGQNWNATSIGPNSGTALSVSCANDCVVVGPAIGSTGSPVVSVSNDTGNAWQSVESTSNLSSSEFDGVTCLTTECIAIGETSGGTPSIVQSNEGISSWGANVS